MNQDTPKHSARVGATNERIPHKNKFIAKWHHIIEPWLRLDLRTRILILSAVGVFLIAATSATLRALVKVPDVQKSTAFFTPPVEEPEPTTIPSPLTGVEVKKSLAQLPVTGVMIENSPDARPQAGLKEAGVVFEAISEGGITRFLALFQEAKPDRLGPVRSVRPYYLDFLVPFDAAIAHAGGSAQALAEIRSQDIKDLDHSVNGNAYERSSSRYAPHNLYTTRDKLLAVHNQRGYNKSKFDGFARKEESPAKSPSATKINFEISGFLYNTSYIYDKESNSYKRSMAGKPHTDEVSGKQITPKVIIALEADRSQNGIYSVYKVSGSGKITVFQDGKAVTGTWSKAGRSKPYVFKDKSGKELALNPGQTWITLIQAGRYSFSK